MEENNITQIIIDTINTILGNLFGSIDNNLYSILDDISFISSDILDDKNFENIFGTSASNGILLIANSNTISNYEKGHIICNGSGSLHAGRRRDGLYDRPSSRQRYPHLYPRRIRRAGRQSFHLIRSGQVSRPDLCGRERR